MMNEKPELSFWEWMTCWNFHKDVVATFVDVEFTKMEDDDDNT